MKYGSIYCITNLINNKKYIGLTTRDINSRFKEHIKADSYIGNAIRKHGCENFKIEEIDEAETKEELCDNEIYWIKRYDTFNSGYNQTRGGEGTSTIALIPINLNEKQKKYIDFVHKENKKKIDINNKYEVMKSLLMNIVDVYLNAEIIADKKRSATFINRLKPNYFQSIERLNIIDFEEMKSYL